ncbi:MAG: acyltransferase [Gemmatimonadetes bacterium]|nr:acyltransferase [Gemmatimonadota bacterium]
MTLVSSNLLTPTPRPPHSSRGSSYRPDIDGLRAIAVVSVILFHLEVRGFGGGFVGVDVFFVISGFLISRNILQDLEGGRFSFARFYLRRARRLFPALLTTLAATFAVGAVVLSPDHLVSLGRSLAAAIVSGSNILFWQEAGYFDANATVKPLLHTWSLSVEEQFYLVWPLAMVGLWRGGGSRRVLGFLVIAMLLSLVGAEVLWPSDREAVFYLAPFRVAELAIGALCVWVVDRLPKSQWLAEGLGVLGLTAIAFSILRYSPRTPFPGMYALMPCLGTAALICAKDGRHVLGFLSQPVARVTGLLSYSLYLVHWPILVFVRYRADGVLTNHGRAAVLVLTVVSAIAMYLLVEKRYRHATGRATALRPSQFAAACVALAVTLALPAIHAWRSGGWTWRMPRELQLALGDKSEIFRRRQVGIRSPECHVNGAFDVASAARSGCLSLREGTPNFLVVGDSHAADLWMALHGAYPSVNFLQATGAGCLPIESLYTTRDVRCGRMLQYIKQQLPGMAQLDGVILAGRWNRRVDQLTGELAGELASYRALDVPVAVFGPIAEFSPDVRTLAFRFGRLEGFDDFARRFMHHDRAPLERRLAQIVTTDGSGYVSTFGVVCKRGTCPMVDERNNFLIADYGHWTVEGAEYFGRQLVQLYPSPSQFFDDDAGH